LVGKKLNVPKARDCVPNTVGATETGEAVIVAAFAAGENAGPNNMITARTVPINMRCGPLLLNVLDANRREVSTRLGMEDRNG
jgi:hypothetical protein